MGRKPSTFSGLSQFVLEAFKQGDDPAASSSTAQPSSHQTPTPSRPSTSQKPRNFVTSQRAAPSDSASDSTSGDASPSIGVVRKADALDEVDPDEEEAAETRGGKGKSREKEQSTPARKKRKVGLLGPGYESVDATGLVPFYTDASEVPAHLRKYFFQRNRYFSLYDEGCLLDDEGWYSVTPERVAARIAERCRCGTVLDAFCGVGGNAIAFAQTCERVIALDTSPTRLALARHNAAIYGVEDRIEFVLADYLSFARTLLALPSKHRRIDVVFLSPPWGGPEYISGAAATTTTPSTSNPTPTPKGKAKGKGKQNPKETASTEEHPEYTLASIRPIHGADLFALTRQITKNVAYFLPRNTSLEELSALVPSAGGTSGTSEQGEQMEVDAEGDERIEVEEEWMGSKLKALTVYFGGLAAGQEHMFDENS